MPSAEWRRCRELRGAIPGLTGRAKPPKLAARGGCRFQGPRFQAHLGVEADFRPAVKAHPGFEIEVPAALAEVLAVHGHGVTWGDEVPGQERFHTTDPCSNRLEFLRLL